jgi:hypothetical protein
MMLLTMSSHALPQQGLLLLEKPELATASITKQWDLCTDALRIVRGVQAISKAILAQVATGPMLGRLDSSFGLLHTAAADAVVHASMFACLQATSWT